MCPVFVNADPRTNGLELVASQAYIVLEVSSSHYNSLYHTEKIADNHNNFFSEI